MLVLEDMKSLVKIEPVHGKTSKMTCGPAITQISLGIRQSSLGALWVAKDWMFLHVDS